MNRIKSLILVMAMMSIAAALSGQVSYSYDKAGNRVKAVLIMERMNEQNKEAAQKKGNQEHIAPENSNTVQVYPNPASSMVHIAFHDEATHHITIYDMAGKKVRAYSASSRLTIDVSDLKWATYIIDISSGERHSQWKLIKQ